MATAFLVLLLLTMYHFVYEAILLPIIRLNLRYKLFKNRDELISLKIDSNNSIPDSVFEILLFSINSTLNRLPYFNIYNISIARRKLKKDPALKRKIDKRVGILNNSNNLKIKLLAKSTENISLFAFFLNSASWLLYFSPIVIIIFIVKQVFTFAFGLKRLLRELAFASNHDFGKITPDFEQYANSI
ncbi:MAG: hypothetical protein ACOCWM_03010 [Cyclobacteriaceae bacterium]